MFLTTPLLPFRISPGKKVLKGNSQFCRLFLSQFPAPFQHRSDCTLYRAMRGTRDCGVVLQTCCLNHPSDWQLNVPEYRPVFEMRIKWVSCVLAPLKAARLSRQTLEDSWASGTLKTCIKPVKIEIYRHTNRFQVAVCYLARNISHNSNGIAWGLLKFKTCLALLSVDCLNEFSESMCWGNWIYKKKQWCNWKWLESWPQSIALFHVSSWLIFSN